MSMGRVPGIVPNPMTLANPAVLLTIVRSRAPWSRSARIRFCGVPPGPAKPSIINVAPSGMSETASVKLLTTLSNAMLPSVRVSGPVGAPRLRARAARRRSAAVRRDAGARPRVRSSSQPPVAEWDEGRPGRAFASAEEVPPDHDVLALIRRASSVRRYAPRARYRSPMPRASARRFLRPRRARSSHGGCPSRSRPP